MTAPLPIDVSDIDSPLPDPSHEAIRATALKAISVVWTNHLDLLAKLTASQGDLAAAQGALADALGRIAAMQSALDALTARVTALETPPVPNPAPTA